MNVDELLVCPVCNNDLPLPELRSQGKLKCASCEYVFTYDNGIYDFTPVPIPDINIQKQWNLWEKLQENGRLAYKLAPEASCSIKTRKDVIAWSNFLKLKTEDIVLDIGCGPCGKPGYFERWHNKNIVGIDPLSPFYNQQDMVFIKGIAEYLPFKNHSFDVISVATTMDHVLSPSRVFDNIKRCLKPEGRLLIWMSQESTEKSINILKRAYIYLIRISSLLGNILTGNKRDIDNKEPYWITLNKTLSIPEGAIDQYHIHHDSYDDLKILSDQKGFIIKKQKCFNNVNIFIEYILVN